MRLRRDDARRTRTALAALLTVLAVVFVAACDTSGQDRSASSPRPTAVTPTAAGMVPESFPMPSNVIGSTSASTDADEVRVQFEVDSSYEELVTFFDGELTGRGWEIINRREAGDTTRYRIEGNGWTGAVTVFGGLDPVAFLVQLGSADAEAST